MLIPVFALVPVLAPVPGTLFSPHYHIVGQAPGLVPKASGYLQAPPPVYRNDAACGMAVPDLLLCLFPNVADIIALLLLPFPSSIPSPFPLPSPFASPFLTPLLPSFPFLLPSSSPSYVHFLVSAPVPVPVPAPSPSPPPFHSPFLLPTLFPSSLAATRPSDPVTLSIQYACTDTGPCKRSCRVPASATPCFHR